ncbi:hypothetical protein [Plantactinospora sp. GCM10030261]|uniref:hypothetical protein n=1 Tax=Plantactinospora sp. GCM10030261 TaxID=3273420 RepID=UPI0036131ED6
MAGDDVRTARRPGAARRPVPRGRSAALVGVIVAGLLVGAALIQPVDTVHLQPVAAPDTAGPEGTPEPETPTSPPQTEPAPSDTPSTPPTNPSPSTPPPVTESPTSPPQGEPTTTPPVATPTTRSPVPPRPPSQPGPGRPNQPARGVSVTTDDLTLSPQYWSAPATVVDLRITVANTGEVAESMRLGYTMPPGLTDAGTPGCATAGAEGWQCAAWTVAPGDRFSTRVRVRVAGDAWRRMPLSGSVRVSSTVPNDPGAQPISDDQGFAVLFPPGPPVPGISLAASEVSFDITGQPTTLEVRLGNTGAVDAAGAIEVVLPRGVTVPTIAAGCAAAGDDRTRCDLGPIAAGATGTVRLPVAATEEAQRNAPLSGAVIGTITPRVGGPRTVQMSFRIVAVAALVTPPAGVGPTGSQGALPSLTNAGDGDGLSSVQKTAIALIGASVLLVVLALGLATTSLRRRMGGAPPAIREEAVPSE